METISQVQARRALIAAQGLSATPRRKATKAGVLAAIERMAALQIDTISVVARSPYFTLWARLGAYDPVWLDELLAEGEVFEAWSHAACYVPKGEFPLYRRRILAADEGARTAYARRWMAEHQAAIEAVLAHVRDAGAVRSADFDNGGRRRTGWWDWKVEKMALEMLFMRGDLMIARREGFQRVYDLTERVRPGWDDAQAPPLAEYYQRMALAAVRALGVTSAGWVAQYFHLPSAPILLAVRELVAEGTLTELRVQDWAKPALMAPESAAGLASRPSRTVLLTPFDPIVWDRDRARALFDFDYTIECYTPAPKRVYGYFTLPILHRDALVGRLDAKAHRKEGRFEVKIAHLEPRVPISEDLVAGLAEALTSCAAWHRTPAVEVTASDPPALAPALREALGARQA